MTAAVLAVLLVAGVVLCGLVYRGLSGPVIVECDRCDSAMRADKAWIGMHDGVPAYLCEQCAHRPREGVAP